MFLRTIKFALALVGSLSIVSVAAGAPGDPGPKQAPETNGDASGGGKSAANTPPVAAATASVPAPHVPLGHVQIKHDTQKNAALVASLKNACSQFKTWRDEVKAPSIAENVSLDADWCKAAMAKRPVAARVSACARTAALMDTLSRMPQPTGAKAQAQQGQLLAALSQVQDSCGGKNRAAAITPATVTDLNALALNAVQGLGEFLVARAKDELTLYGIDEIGKRLCGDAPQKDMMRKLFPESCDVIEGESPLSGPPSGAPSEVDTEGVTSGRLLAAMRRDLAELPVNGVKLMDLLPDDALYVTALASALAELPKGGRLVDVPHEAIGYMLTHQDASGSACDINKILGGTGTAAGNTAPKMPGTHSCVAGLIFEGADQAAQMGASGSVTFEDWFDATAVHYCADFQGETTGDGACILQSEVAVDAVEPTAERWLIAYGRLLDAEKALDQILSAGKLTADNTQQFMLSAANAIEATVEAQQSMLQCFGTYPNCTQPAPLPAGVQKALNVLRGSAALVGATMRGDVPDALRAGRALVILVDSRISTKVLDAVDFGIALSMAKNADDAKQAIEAAAAPVSSYRLKYGVDNGTLISFNALVGFMYATQRNYDRTTLGSSNPKRIGVARLSAPVGIDFTPAFLSGHLFNLGLGGIVLDPLALASFDAKTGDTPKPRLETVFAFGGYMRLGVWRSPVNLVLQSTYQPWLRSDETCGAGHCWRGAWQIAGGVAVDVPIFVLN